MINLDGNAIRCAMARKSFFEYCRLTAPDFYKPNRDYIVKLCDTLQAFYEDKEKHVLIINMPPRHGKSRTGSLFVEWIFGKNREEKIMTASYNELLSSVFAKSVRDAIATEKADASTLVYSDIFPETRVKFGEARANIWALDGSSVKNYLATSPTGTATGFGASLIIVDDIIKNAEEANNAMVKAKHWNWFTNTMLSRLEEGGKIIIIMTRWATNDLAGEAINYFGDRATVISMKAMQDDGTMLCDDVLSKESYLEKARLMGLDIAQANYQQEPIDIKGKMYGEFKTYTSVPQFVRIESYTDTADTGSDYLCSIVYGICDKQAYLLDVIFTKASMEITEPMTAKQFVENDVNRAYIESNNGGRGFARNVQRIMREKYGSNYTSIKSFHQSKNKDARIYSQSAWVNENIYMPSGWRDMWPEFFEHITNYQREGKNAHDDGADALTGVAEMINRKGAVGVLK